jgi:hypothetical protein
LFLINKFYTILFLLYKIPAKAEVKQRWLLMTEEIHSVVAAETATVVVAVVSEAVTPAPGK